MQDQLLSLLKNPKYQKYSGLINRLKEQIKSAYQQLDDIKTQVDNETEEQRSSSGQLFIKSLIESNKQDINILENWLKVNTMAVLNDSNSQPLYREVKELYELSFERDSNLKGILNNHNGIL